MDKVAFDKQVANLFSRHERFLSRKNTPEEGGNGIFSRWQYPVITAQHIPVYWRYDLNYETNPFLMERQGVNAAFNAGAIEFEDKICMIVRVEGADRKSFFAVAESDNGLDNFRFWDYPVRMPQVPGNPDTNVYDMRLTRHEDGWIYGVFCTERKDPAAPPLDQSSAIAQAGVARTKNLVDWERMPDLKTSSPQQRNVVLHPEFVDGKYAFYTRPMDQFIETGSGGGIGWGLADTMEGAVVDKEVIIDPREYHTISEAKNGLGPAPIKTAKGWLQLAHGVRNTAAGLRYVLYMFLTDLNDPSKLLKKPGGLLLGPRGSERVGDVSNVTFSNGWVANSNGKLFIYYASSDQRMHVATTTVEKLLDYVLNTPEDGLKSHICVEQRSELIRRNLEILRTLNPER